MEKVELKKFSVKKEYQQKMVISSFMSLIPPRSEELSWLKYKEGKEVVALRET